MIREKSTFLLTAIFIFLTPILFSQERPVGAGIACIWSNQTQEQNPIVGVIQGFGLWRDIQAAGENSFDWSKYNTAINRAASINKYIYLQINMQVPDWMQDKVAVVGYQKRADDYKGYQFWDPDYLNAHLKLIREFGEFVANHPNRKWVIGVRIQPNGYNTEIFNWILTSWATNPAHGTADNRPVEKNKNTWISQPNGYSASNPKFAPHRSDIHPGTTDTYGEHYMKTVINEYIEVFHPLGIGTSFRATSPLSAAYLDKLYGDHPLMQCLQTSAETSMLSGSDQHKKDEYNDIKKYCRQRGHSAYWEGGGMYAPTWEQEIYWRDLMRLEAGATYSATRMDRWDNGEGCREGMRFFSKYAGYHNLPKLTPGAWIAMIETPENNIKNFGYFISQNNMDATIIKNQITSNHKGYYAKQLNAGATVEFDIDESFAATARGGDATFNITWFSRSDDSWQFQINQGNGLENHGSIISGTGTNTWQTVKFTIPISANSFPSTNDFAIQAISGTPILHMVEIERENNIVSVKMLPESQAYTPVAYPNPVRDILHIKLAETEYRASQIEIISLSGRVVRKIDIPSSRNIYPLNVSELPKGFYIVKADNMQQKILIQ